MIKKQYFQKLKCFTKYQLYDAHPVWGFENTKSRGRNVEKFIYRQNLILLNTGKLEHFNVYNGSTSTTDFTLCSN